MNRRLSAQDLLIADEPHADPTAAINAAEDAKAWFEQNVPKRLAEAEKLFSLDQPSLKNLSHILRHKELWPEGFVWNYSNCYSCAMGLAKTLWEEQEKVFAGLPVSCNMAEAFGMPIVRAKLIFAGYQPEAVYGTCRLDAITPEMVADQIDQYLAEQAA